MDKVFAYMEVKVGVNECIICFRGVRKSFEDAVG